MCGRDDEIDTRICVMCNQEYYGDCGHRDCPERLKNNDASREVSKEVVLPVHVCGKEGNRDCPCARCVFETCVVCLASIW